MNLHLAAVKVLLPSQLVPWFLGGLPCSGAGLVGEAGAGCGHGAFGSRQGGTGEQGVASGAGVGCEDGFACALAFMSVSCGLTGGLGLGGWGQALQLAVASGCGCQGNA